MYLDVHGTSADRVSGVYNEHVSKRRYNANQLPCPVDDQAHNKLISPKIGQNQIRTHSRAHVHRVFMYINSHMKKKSKYEWNHPQ